MSDTKEHILNVSFNLFLQKSYKEVTMQEIVTKTGMSKGAFYYYFESKEQLFLEVIDHFSDSIMLDYDKLSRDSLYQFYHDYIDHLRDTSRFLYRQNEADSGFVLNYYVLMFDAMKLFPSFREKAIATLKTELKAWQEVIGLARERGEIRSSMTDEQISFMFVYTSDGVAMHNIMKAGLKDTPDTLLVVWDGLYEGLKA